MVTRAAALVHIFVTKVIVRVARDEVDQAYSGKVIGGATVFRDCCAEHVDFTAEVGPTKKNLKVIVFPLVAEKVLDRFELTRAASSKRES